MNINPNLSTEAIIKTTQPAHLVFIEKRGAFEKNAPLAWQEFLPLLIAHFHTNEIQSVVGLGHIDKSLQGDDACIYQAGILLAEKPANLPNDLSYRLLPAQTYACYTLKGAYSQLANVYPQVFEMLHRTHHRIQDDFCMEIYLNDPRTTPEADLRTEILIPIK